MCLDKHCHILLLKVDSMSVAQEPIIRVITPADCLQVGEIAKRSLSATQSVFVRTGPHDLVATVGDRVVAVVLLELLNMPRQSRIGRIAWLLTDPDYRGYGIARRLVREALKSLDELGCGAVVTEVEGYNSPSANIFNEMGFRRLGTIAQIRWLGAVDAVLLGLRTQRLFTPGHYLWACQVPEYSESPSVQRFGTWALNVSIAVFAMVMGGGLLLPGELGMPSLSELFAVVTAVIVIMGMREAAMHLVARTKGMILEYRGWGSGIGSSAIIAVFFGSVLPLPGGVYPSGDGWSYHRYRGTLALSAAAGTAMTALLVLAAFYGITQGVYGFAEELGRSILNIGVALLLFDGIIAFGPFQGYNARRLLDHSQWLWMAFVILVICICALAVIV